MVRNRQRKTDKGLHSEQNMREAVELVQNGMSLRNAAESKGVNFVTLYRYVQQKKKNDVEGVEITRMTPNYANRKVFSPEQENALKEYLITCSKMCYGLDTIEARRLAYELALHLNLSMPQSWTEKKIAGIDWLYGYKKRHPDITLRKPEACSLSRATSFNKHNVTIFFDNLEDVIKRHSVFADGTRMYCLDETSTTTVQKPRKVLAAKASRQLNKVTSAERGTLVTTCCIVSATGCALPPAMIFPRKKFQNHMLNGAPPGTLGLSQPTGWMTGEMFVEVIKHFIKITSSSKENPTLILLDNHESHLNPAVLNIAKDNGVTLLTIPPHTSHRLQALDVSVFGPFQNYYNSAADSWMHRHPGQTLTIYQVAEIMGIAFDKAMTPSNIKSGFKKTGIFPFDRNVFIEDDFFQSEVTNRELQTPSEPAIAELHPTSYFQQPSTSMDRNFKPAIVELPSKIDLEQASTSSTGSNAPLETNKNLDNALTSLKSPIGCRDYPKAGPRKSGNKRKKGKSLVLTDTPVKVEIEELARQRDEKKRKINSSKLKAEQVKKATKRILSSPISSEGETEVTTIDLDEEGEENLPLITMKTPTVKDFVIVRFSGKQIKFFIGEILSEANENYEYDISYMRKSNKRDNSFFFPLEPDLALVSIIDIELVLPSPSFSGKTKRQAHIYTFPSRILKKYYFG